jgi:hypothetical protein
MKPQTTLRASLADPNLLDLGAASWAAWRPLLLACMGEALTADELAFFTRFTGRTEAPPGAWTRLGSWPAGVPARPAPWQRWRSTSRRYARTLTNWDAFGLTGPGRRP